MNPVTLPSAVPATIGTVSQLLDFARRAQETQHKYMTPSLTQYTKTTNIMSRVYLEESILRDEICPALFGTMNQIYTSYILSAFNLDTLCANGRTVQEMFQAVGTEHLDILREIKNTFGKSNYTFSNENTIVDLEPMSQRLPVGRLIELSMTGAVALDTHSADVSTSQQRTDNHGSETARDKDGQDVGKNHSDSEGTTSSSSVSTRNTTTESTYSFKAYLYVQLIPYVLQPDVVKGYVSANFDPPISSRWLQFKAGEISFWNDFVFTHDLIKKQSDILRKDRSGIISEMMNKNRGRLARWLLGVTHIRPVSHNTANSIMICSKEAFDQACADSHLDFRNPAQRQAFFTKTWSMILCVVDQHYNTVDMYFNGLDVKGTYSFEMINHVGTKGSDNNTLKDFMTAFSRGLSPKF